MYYEQSDDRESWYLLRNLMFKGKLIMTLPDSYFNLVCITSAITVIYDE